MKRIIIVLLALFTLCSCSSKKNNSIEGTWYMIDISDPLNTDLNQVVFNSNEVKTTIEGVEKTTTYSIQDNTFTLNDDTVFNDTTYTFASKSSDYVILTSSYEDPIVFIKSISIINDISSIYGNYSVIYSSYLKEGDTVEFDSNSIKMKRGEDLVAGPIEYIFKDNILDTYPDSELYEAKGLLYKINDDQILWVEDNGSIIILEHA